MQKKKKTRLNLYLSKDIVDFAKDWSYVTDIPISRMLEEYLSRQQKIVLKTTPFQWLNDPLINPSLAHKESHFNDLDDYLNNPEEEKFCSQNPDHPRAKIRRSLLKEYELYLKETIENQKKMDKDLIKRWMEVFSLQ